MNTSPGLPPADWYDDPLGAAQKRYWDGSRWTSNTVSPIPESVPMPAPPGTPGDNAESPMPGQEASRTHTSEGHLILTELVERMPDVESRLGVRIDSLLGVFVKSEYETAAIVLGDLVAETKPRTGDLEVIATTYNASGQVTGKEYDYIDVSRKSPTPFRLTLDIDEPPARIRLMAKPG